MSARTLAILLALGLLASVGLPERASARERGVTLAPSDPAEGEARLALVIGNGDYESVPLANPVNDAEDMTEALRNLGFTVMRFTDVDQESMEDAIRAFGKRLRNGGVGLFYYAGHGVQVEGRNFLIPVGARVLSRKDVKYKAVDMGQVLDELDQAGNRLNIMIIDACRDNPFRGFRGGTRGLAKTDAPRGTIVAYATAPGSVAADGDGRNGMYTKHLLSSLEKPGMPIEQVFKRVRIAVVGDTGGAQTPWESSSLTGEFYFREPDAPPSITALLGISDAQKFDTQDMVEEARKLWSERLDRMKGAHDDAVQYERGSAPPSLKAQLWERFEAAFSDDHPESDEDDALRKNARDRAAHWNGVARREDDGREAFSVEDLVAEGRDAAKQRLAWTREAFDEAKGYERGDVPPALKRQAWARFLTSFPNDPSTDGDDEMRQHAEEQVAHWGAQAGGEAAPEFGVDDLVEQAQKVKEQRLAKIQKAFDEATAYEKGTGPAPLKEQAWSRFLEVFPDVAGELSDDRLRKVARERRDHWKSQPDDLEAGEFRLASGPPSTPQWSSDQQVAARQALEEYRTAYEARDLDRLGRIWVMNPDQREALRTLFDCADEVELAIDEKGLTPAPGSVAILFEQRLEFAGPRCMMRSDGKPAEMTATLIQGGNGWMISSILPRLRR